MLSTTDSSVGPHASPKSNTTLSEFKKEYVIPNLIWSTIQEIMESSVSLKNKYKKLTS